MHNPSYHFAVKSYTPAELANHIREQWYSLELGWHNLFGESWEVPYSNLSALGEDASSRQILRAIPSTFLPYLSILHCASCRGLSPDRINFGSAPATFWVCDKCVTDAQHILQSAINTPLEQNT